MPSTADCIALLIKQAFDLPNQNDVLSLIVSSVASPLDRLELGEFRLPVAQHMGLDRTELANLTDGEIALRRNWREFVVILRFQHTLLLLLSVFVLAEKSLPVLP